MRALVASENVADDELQLAPLSKTGYVGVIEVGLKYQPRIQVPGDGKGGTKKRRQYSLPGLFDTAKEAAIIRAATRKGMKEQYGSLAASDAAASLCTIVWLILICICYVIVYIRTEDNLCTGLWFGHRIGIWFSHVEITLENPTPLLGHPDRGWSLLAFW